MFPVVSKPETVMESKPILELIMVMMEAAREEILEMAMSGMALG